MPLSTPRSAAIFRMPRSPLTSAARMRRSVLASMGAVAPASCPGPWHGPSRRGRAPGSSLEVAGNGVERGEQQPVYRVIFWQRVRGLFGDHHLRYRVDIDPLPIEAASE